MHMLFLDLLMHIHAGSKRCKQDSSAVNNLGVEQKSTCEADCYPRISVREIVHGEGYMLVILTNPGLL
jgi:hypothetical protein